MKLLTAVLALALSGCAMTHQAGLDAANRGDLAAAERLLSQAVQEGDNRAWNNLGVIYERMGQQDKAIQHYIMGARWGDATAQRNLVNAGVPVPAPDLASHRANVNASNAASTANTLMLMQALNPPPAARPALQHPTNCTSQRVGNQVQTICR